MLFTGQIFALDSAVVTTQKTFSLHVYFWTYVMHHHREMINISYLKAEYTKCELFMSGVALAFISGIWIYAPSQYLLSCKWSTIFIQIIWCKSFKVFPARSDFNSISKNNYKYHNDVSIWCKRMNWSFLFKSFLASGNFCHVLISLSTVWTQIRSWNNRFLSVSESFNALIGFLK